MKIIPKLTSWEWEGLVSDCNLADGHAHQGQTKKQLQVISKLGNIYLDSESKTQSQIQTNFEHYFFKNAGQHSYKKLLPPQYHYACSLAIEVVANYLRLNNKSVSLIQPTFDNLADILKRHNVNLVPIDESVLTDTAKLIKITTDVLMIVCPNNPTGQEISKKEFKQIVDVCKKKKITLVLDFSFRFYSNFTLWDQYEILYKSKMNFIILEDTGKTFPTLDLKLGILLASNSIYYKLQEVTNDFLLNVSPFIFSLLTEYIKTEARNAIPSYKRIIEINRKKLIAAFKNTSWEVQNLNSKLSVAWIKVPKGKKSQNLCKWLESKNIFVLPGKPFFWRDQELGDSYFRVALARVPDFFEKAIKKLVKACNQYLE